MIFGISLEGRVPNVPGPIGDGRACLRLRPNRHPTELVS